MKGLISQAEQESAQQVTGEGGAPAEMAEAGAGAAPTGVAAGGEAQAQGEEGGEPVSEEEQQWYDGIQQAAADILFNDDKASKAVMSMLNAKQPALSVGNAAAEVMLQVDRGMDGEIPETVILPASEEILGHVLDIAQAAKLLTRSEQVDGDAAQAMVARLAEEYGVDPEDFKQAQARVGSQVA